MSFSNGQLAAFRVAYAAGLNANGGVLYGILRSTGANPIGFPLDGSVISHVGQDAAGICVSGSGDVELQTCGPLELSMPQTGGSLVKGSIAYADVDGKISDIPGGDGGIPTHSIRLGVMISDTCLFIQMHPTVEL